MNINIRKVKNGFILNDLHNEEEVVFQEFDNDIENFVDLLRYLESIYGTSSSRYTDQIRIKIYPGDKSTNKVSTCPLCYSDLRDDEDKINEEIEFKD